MKRTQSRLRHLRAALDALAAEDSPPRSKEPKFTHRYRGLANPPIDIKIIIQEEPKRQRPRSVTSPFSPKRSRLGQRSPKKVSDAQIDQKFQDFCKTKQVNRYRLLDYFYKWRFLMQKRAEQRARHDSQSSITPDDSSFVLLISDDELVNSGFAGSGYRRVMDRIVDSDEEIHVLQPHHRAFAKWRMKTQGRETWRREIVGGIQRALKKDPVYRHRQGATRKSRRLGESPRRSGEPVGTTVKWKAQEGGDVIRRGHAGVQKYRVRYGEKPVVGALRAKTTQDDVKDADYTEQVPMRATRIRFESPGKNGETIQRELSDIPKGALGEQEAMSRDNSKVLSALDMSFSSSDDAQPKDVAEDGAKKGTKIRFDRNDKVIRAEESKAPRRPAEERELVDGDNSKVLSVLDVSFSSSDSEGVPDRGSAMETGNRARRARFDLGGNLSSSDSGKDDGSEMRHDSEVTDVNISSILPHDSVQPAPQASKAPGTRFASLLTKDTIHKAEEAASSHASDEHESSTDSASKEEHHAVRTNVSHSGSEEHAESSPTSDNEPIEVNLADTRDLLTGSVTAESQSRPAPANSFSDEDSSMDGDEIPEEKVASESSSAEEAVSKAGADVPKPVAPQGVKSKSIGSDGKPASEAGSESFSEDVFSESGASTPDKSLEQSASAQKEASGSYDLHIDVVIDDDGDSPKQLASSLDKVDSESFSEDDIVITGNRGQKPESREDVAPAPESESLGDVAEDNLASPIEPSLSKDSESSSSEGSELPPAKLAPGKSSSDDELIDDLVDNTGSGAAKPGPAVDASKKAAVSMGSQEVESESFSDVDVFVDDDEVVAKEPESVATATQEPASDSMEFESDSKGDVRSPAGPGESPAEKHERSSSGEIDIGESFEAPNQQALGVQSESFSDIDFVDEPNDDGKHPSAAVESLSSPEKSASSSLSNSGLAINGTGSLSIESPEKEENDKVNLDVDVGDSSGSSKGDSVSVEVPPKEEGSDVRVDVDVASDSSKGDSVSVEAHAKEESDDVNLDIDVEDASDSNKGDSVSVDVPAKEESDDVNIDILEDLSDSKRASDQSPSKAVASEGSSSDDVQIEMDVPEPAPAVPSSSSSDSTLDIVVDNSSDDQDIPIEKSDSDDNAAPKPEDSSSSSADVPIEADFSSDEDTKPAPKSDVDQLLADLSSSDEEPAPAPPPKLGLSKAPVLPKGALPEVPADLVNEVKKEAEPPKPAGGFSRPPSLGSGLSGKPAPRPSPSSVSSLFQRLSHIGERKESRERGYMRQFFTEVLFNTIKDKKAKGLFTPMIQVPSNVTKPFGITNDYSDLMVELLNETVDTVDLSGFSYEGFLDRIEAILNSGGEWTLKKRLALPQDVPTKGEREHEYEQVQALLNIADALIKRELQNVLQN